MFKETNSVASDDPFPDTLFPTTEPAIDKIVPQFTTPSHSVSGKIGKNIIYITLSAEMHNNVGEIQNEISSKSLYFKL